MKPGTPWQRDLGVRKELHRGEGKKTRKGGTNDSDGRTDSLKS